MKWQLLSYVDHVKPQKRLPGLKVCPPLTNIEDGHEKITQQLNSKLTLKVSSDFGTCRSDGDWVGCQGDGRCSHNRAEQQPAQTETGLESGRHLDTDPARLQQSSTAVETVTSPLSPAAHTAHTTHGGDMSGDEDNNSEVCHEARSRGQASVQDSLVTDSM